jgi:ribosomal protein L11 methyltransferase
VHAVVLRVRVADTEPVLDRLLPLAPSGVYERANAGIAELVVAGRAERDALVAAAGDALVGLAELDLPEDAEERAVQLGEPPVVAGRFAIRAPAAPPSSDPRVEDIVIDRGHAFGTGLHPTTQRCLELLLALEPGGSFADLGSGTGVLGIAAARMGWGPVVAVDYDERSVEAAQRNAELNGVALTAWQADLTVDAPPGAGTLVANVPAAVHAGVRAGLQETPRHVIVSGVTPEEADAVVASYVDLGLAERRRLVEANWAAVLLTAEDVAVGEPPEVPARPAPPVPEAAPPESLPTSLPRQLETPLPDGGLALSSSHDLPTGARVAVLLAPGLFRLDLRHLEDTLKLSIRNLSGTTIRALPTDRPPAMVRTAGDVTIDYPVATNARMRLLIGTRHVNVVLSALSGPEPGAGRVTAQAIVGPP